MKIALHGASGRMGAALLSVIRQGDHQVVGAIAAPTAPEIGRDLGEAHGLASLGVGIQADVSSAVLGADVIIDFSHVSAVADLARCASRAGIALVSGTTGLDGRAQEALDQAAQRVPVLWSANFSFGIQVLAELVRYATARLGAAFDVEVVEVHHRAKVDAPSGTATRLVSEVQAVRADTTITHGRQGLVGARPSDQIGVMAVRGGDVVGEHTVYFLGQGERLVLSHSASSRDLLARGAVFAAEALLHKKPGGYVLSDILPPL